MGCFTELDLATVIGKLCELLEVGRVKIFQVWRRICLAEWLKQPLFDHIFRDLLYGVLGLVIAESLERVIYIIRVAIALQFLNVFLFSYVLTIVKSVHQNIEHGKTVVSSTGAEEAHLIEAWKLDVTFEMISSIVITQMLPIGRQIRGSETKVDKGY